MIYDIFVNCKWVVTRWQFYNTHLHTNNTQNDTKTNNTQNNTKFENTKITKFENTKITHVQGHKLFPFHFIKF